MQRWKTLHYSLFRNSFVEEYKKDYFPIVPFRWMQKPLGFQGRGIAEELFINSNRNQQTLNHNSTFNRACNRSNGIRTGRSQNCSGPSVK